MNVSIYRNVRQHCWSIKAHAGSADGRVIAHTQGAILADARWSVSVSDRGFISGDLLWLHPDTSFVHDVTEKTLGAQFTPAGEWDCENAVRIDQGYRQFIRRLDGAQLTRSHRAILAPDGRAYAIRTNACAEALEVAA